MENCIGLVPTVARPALLIRSRPWLILTHGHPFFKQPQAMDITTCTVYSYEMAEFSGNIRLTCRSELRSAKECLAAGGDLCLGNPLVKPPLRIYQETGCGTTALKLFGGSAGANRWPATSADERVGLAVGYRCSCPRDCDAFPNRWNRWSIVFSDRRLYHKYCFLEVSQTISRTTTSRSQVPLAREPAAWAAKRLNTSIPTHSLAGCRNNRAMKIFFLGYPDAMDRANTESWHTAMRKHGTADAYVFQWGFQRSELEKTLLKFGYDSEQGHIIRGTFAFDEMEFKPRTHPPGEDFWVGRLRDRTSTNGVRITGTS